MAAPNSTGQWIEIKAADGGKFRGYLALPASGKGPGIVLCQEIFGVNALYCLAQPWRSPICCYSWLFLARAARGPCLFTAPRLRVSIRSRRVIAAYEHGGCSL